MISIRPVDPEEAGILSHIAFSAKAHWGYPEHWLELWKPQLTFEPGYFQTGESWAAVTNQIPVAFYTLWKKNGVAWLENLWVLPEYIGKGLGKHLFAHAANRARKMGFDILQLEADPNAVGFYGNMGMQQIGERSVELDGVRRVLPIFAIDL